MNNYVLFAAITIAIIIASTNPIANPISKPIPIDFNYLI